MEVKRFNEMVSESQYRFKTKEEFIEEYGDHTPEFPLTDAEYKHTENWRNVLGVAFKEEMDYLLGKPVPAEWFENVDWVEAHFRNPIKNERMEYNREKYGIQNKYDETCFDSGKQLGIPNPDRGGTYWTMQIDMFKKIN